MSRRITFIEARRSSASRLRDLLSSAGTSSSVVSMKLLVVSLSHMFFTRSYTSFIAVVAKSLMVNRKVGQVVAKGVTRKVTALEDHTLRWRRESACSGVML